MDVKHVLVHKTCIVCGQDIASKSLSAVNQCHSHSQPCNPKGQSSGRRCAFYQEL
jgi:hypothetical protein